MQKTTLIASLIIALIITAFAWIFFWVSEAAQLEGVEIIEFPKLESKKQYEQTELIAISVNDNGKIIIRELEVSLEDLSQRLSEITTNGYEERIYLKADQGADFAVVKKVMVHLNSAGFLNIGLVTDPVSQ